jgi:hypothetical protein
LLDLTDLSTESDQAQTRIQKRVAEMDVECGTLCEVIQHLAEAADRLRSTFDR